MPSKSGRLSVRDVALRAGVSVSTVSYVINNDPRIKEPTASRVREAMKEIGYVPLPPSSRRGPHPRKRGGEALDKVLLLYVKMARSVLGAPVYAQVVGGIEKALREHNLDLLVRFIDSPEELAVDNSWRKDLAGVILFAVDMDPVLDEALRLLPCVDVMGNFSVEDYWDHIGVDDEYVGRLAARHMLSLGHKLCACVADGPRFRRELFFKIEMEAAGGSVVRIERDMMVIDADKHYVNRRKMETAIDALASLSPRPGGVFFLTDMLTAAAYPIMIEKGLLPGRDIDVVSCNNEELLMMNLHPRPPVVDVRAGEIGRRAVDQLLWRRANLDAPLQRVCVRPELRLPQA